MPIYFGAESGPTNVPDELQPSALANSSALKYWATFLQQLSKSDKAGAVLVLRDETERELSVFRRFAPTTVARAVARDDRSADDPRNWFNCDLHRPPNAFMAKAQTLLPSVPLLEVKECAQDDSAANTCIAKCLAPTGLTVDGSTHKIDVSRLLDIPDQVMDKYGGEDRITCEGGGWLKVDLQRNASLIRVSKQEQPSKDWYNVSDADNSTAPSVSNAAEPSVASPAADSAAAPASDSAAAPASDSAAAPASDSAAAPASDSAAAPASDSAAAPPATEAPSRRSFYRI